MLKILPTSSNVLLMMDLLIYLIQFLIVLIYFNYFLPSYNFLIDFNISHDSAFLILGFK